MYLNLNIVGLVILFLSFGYFLVPMRKVRLGGVSSFYLGITMISFVFTVPMLFEFSSLGASCKGDYALSLVFRVLTFNMGVLFPLTLLLLKPQGYHKEIVVPLIILMASLYAPFVTLNDYLLVWYEGFIPLIFLFIYIGFLLSHHKFSHVNQKALIQSLVVFLIILLFILFLDERLHLYQNKDLTLLAIYIPLFMLFFYGIHHRDVDFTLGSVIGTSLLTSTLYLGITILSSQEGIRLKTDHFFPFTHRIPHILYLDIPFLFLLLILILFPYLKNKQFKKWQGVILLLLYGIYVIYFLIYK